MRRRNKRFYVNGEEFRDFVNKEFDATVIHATIKELAGFAFGSLEEAINAFKLQGGMLGDARRNLN